MGTQEAGGDRHVGRFLLARPRRLGGFRIATVLVAAVVLIAAGVEVVRVMQPSAQNGQKIGAPSYLNPSTDSDGWDRLIASTPGSVGFAVANVLSGPGSQPDPEWTDVIDREHASGTKVLGYVDTGYFGTTGVATRSGATSIAEWRSQIEADVNAWYTLYGSGIDGIFFDQAQNVCGPTSGSNAWAELYAQITAYVKTNHRGAVTAINPGDAVPRCYENTADVIMTFEGSYATYVNDYRTLSWGPVEPSKIWHVIYDASSQADMENAVTLSKSRNAGYVYVTDGVLANPYDTLPAAGYWSAEQNQVAPGL